MKAGEWWPIQTWTCFGVQTAAEEVGGAGVAEGVEACPGRLRPLRAAGFITRPEEVGRVEVGAVRSPRRRGASSAPGRSFGRTRAPLPSREVIGTSRRPCMDFGGPKEPFGAVGGRGRGAGRRRSPTSASASASEMRRPVSARKASRSFHSSGVASSEGGQLVLGQAPSPGWPRGPPRPAGRCGLRRRVRAEQALLESGGEHRLDRGEREPDGAGETRPGIRPFPRTSCTSGGCGSSSVQRAQVRQAGPRLPMWLAYSLIMRGSIAASWTCPKNGIASRWRSRRYSANVTGRMPSAGAALVGVEPGLRVRPRR